MTVSVGGGGETGRSKSMNMSNSVSTTMRTSEQHPMAERICTTTSGGVRSDDEKVSKNHGLIKNLEDKSLVLKKMNSVPSATAAN